MFSLPHYYYFYITPVNNLIFVEQPSRWKKLSEQESGRGDAKELLRDCTLLLRTLNPWYNLPH